MTKLEQFKKELKKLLKKHNAYIYMEGYEDDSFINIGIGIHSNDSDFSNEQENIDGGYRDAVINYNDL